ncbi:MAG: GntP family permease [Treponema sp.]|nr:GntP family permease [Treponema sp.]
MSLSLVSIFLGLGLLMYLAYRGNSIIWVAPLCAAFVALLSGINVINAYTGYDWNPTTRALYRGYMGGAANYFLLWFPSFFLGAVYGKVMDMTGSARSLAEALVKLIGSKRAVLAVVLPCMLMTYGGISLFVVVFVIYPMGYAIYRAANLPRTLLPGAIAFGAFGITMTTVPGTPQIQNIIPTRFYGTTPMAAIALSIVGMVLIGVPGYLYLEWEAGKARKALRGFEEDPKFEEAAAGEALPKWHWLAGLLPILTVIIVLNVFGPMMGKPVDQGGLGIATQQQLVIALLCGIVLCCLMNIKQYKILLPSISSGANGSLTAIMNTSCAVGFGTVVQMVPGFAALQAAMLNMPGNILFSESVAVNVLAGATGSASGGMSIALTALADKYKEMALALANGVTDKADAINQLLHRVASQSSGGLDTLPHNGAVLTLLAVSHCTHKESYKGVFITTCLIPTVMSMILALIWGFTI